MQLNLRGVWAMVVALGLISMCGPNASAAIVIGEGLVSDWGVTLLDGTTGTPTPTIVGSLSNGTDTLGGAIAFGQFSQFWYMYEDNSDVLGDGGVVGPNQGGQNYDAEFLGVGHDATDIYILILTGQRPDNDGDDAGTTPDFSRYSPGDILITTTSGLYGIEVGGGPGGVAGTGAGGNAVNEGDAGSTYTVPYPGLTTGYSTPTWKAGDLLSGTTWINDPIGPQIDKVQLSGGTVVGSADYYYSRNLVSGQHAYIELKISKALFGTTTIQSIQWAPSCGNDVVNSPLVVSTNFVTDVPEPASVALALMGGFGLLGVRRYRRKG